MAQQQQLDMGKWQGLFEWSMKYQGGDRSGCGPQPLDPEKKAWLDQALQEFMKDFADRMKEINTSLAAADDSSTSGGAEAQHDASTSLADKEALCDELMEIVEIVDYARDLHKIGGLPTLLSLMSSPHPSLRWRAAEIAATCMANNPPVQRWFMQEGVLPPLLALLADSHPVVATKAVLGLSALVRHYNPGLEAFRLGGGLEKLLALLGCPTDPAIPQQQQQQQPEDDADNQQQRQQQRRRLQRKVLALLQYVLAKHPKDGFAAAEFGVVPQLQQLLLASGDDSDMRAAVLAVLVEVVSTPEGWQWVNQHNQELAPSLQQVQRQQQQQAGGSADDGDDDDEVKQLLGQLLQVLQSDTPPRARAQGLADHIDLDPYQDGRERAEPHTLPLPQQQQQPQSSASQQPTPPPAAAAAAPPVSAASAGWALTAVPKQDLR